MKILIIILIIQLVILIYVTETKPLNKLNHSSGTLQQRRRITEKVKQSSSDCFCMAKHLVKKEPVSTLDTGEDEETILAIKEGQMRRNPMLRFL